MCFKTVEARCSCHDLRPCQCKKATEVVTCQLVVSKTVDDDFQRHIAEKSLKQKSKLVQSMQVSTWTWISGIALQLQQLFFHYN